MGQKGLQIFNFGGMKNEELELKVVMKKNTEMAAKLSCYRRQNQELRKKNENLNTWVQNLSQVFACISSTWQEVGLIEDGLQVLLKKKTDVKDQMLLRKYMSQFNTFASIVSNLGEKIQNEGHSDETAQDVKERLQSFVRNYQIFLKQLVDNFFKFNDQYSELLNKMRENPEIQTFTRNLMTKELENRQKIKEFQSFMESFNQKSKVFEAFNNHTLLHGIINQKEKEISTLKNTIYQFQRRIKAIFDYNSASIDLQLQNSLDSYQCYCGGAQLQYMRQKWQEHLASLTLKQQTIQKNRSEEDRGQKVDEEKYLLLEEQKESLIKRNSILLEQINKIRLQFKLTDELVLKSNVYLDLKEQCQYVMDYVADLLMRIKKNQEYLVEIQRVREQQIRIIKQKSEATISKDKGQQNLAPVFSKNPLQFFKAETNGLITQLIKVYRDFTERNNKPEQERTRNKELISQLKKDNDDLNKRLNQLQMREIAKSEHLEFRHEKFKQLQNKLNPLIKESIPDLMALWQDFLIYVKGRDRKIKDIESALRKKDRQLTQKTKLSEIMDSTIKQTEEVFMTYKSKLEKTEQFVRKFEKELLRLADENFHQKSEFEQQKNLLAMKLKTESQARNKLEIKAGFISQIEEQIKVIKDNERQLQGNYEKWISEHKQKFEEAAKSIEQHKMKIKLLEDEIIERDKQTTKLLNEKQGFKSEIRELKGKLNSIKDKSEESLLKMELEEYKSKVMCVCTGDRQKTVVLRTCPHMWCKKCIQDSRSNRFRACPKCRIKFGNNDIYEIQWE